MFNIEQSRGVKMSWFNEKLPETAEAFAKMRESLFKDSALDVKTKELIAVASSTLMRCEYCTKVHAERAMQQGATKEQIAEAVGVAMFVASGSQIFWNDIYEDIIGDSDAPDEKCSCCE